MPRLERSSRGLDQHASSLRTDQVSSVLQRALQEVIMDGLGDPRIKGMVTITGVNVASDLDSARVHVSILPAEYSKVTMGGLAAACGHVRSRLRDKVALRRIPRLEFVLDESIKKQASVENAIRDGLEPGDETGEAADPADQEGQE